IVPKTREEYVAEFLQLYKKSAAAQKNRGINPVAATESEARREIEMYRLAYEAQRSLDYWEFGEFWDEIGFRRGAICKFVQIGKAYPSLLRHIEVGGQAAAASMIEFITHIPYHAWFRSDYRRRFEEHWVNAETHYKEKEQELNSCATLTTPDPNEPKIGVEEPILPDNETIVPRTREEYVAEFLQLYAKSAQGPTFGGMPALAFTQREARREIEMHRLAYGTQRSLGEFWDKIGIAPVALTESEARREIEMYRVAYEAQRTLDYWEFAEFWKEIGLRRGAICKFVHIGKAYPSMLRCI